MSCEEKVTPGKVNSLIDFFEKRGDDTPKHQQENSYKQFTQKTNKMKQEMIEGYFTGPPHHYVDEADVNNGQISVETQECLQYENDSPVNGNAYHQQVESFSDSYEQNDSLQQSTQREVSYECESATFEILPTQNKEKQQDVYSQDQTEKNEIQISYQYQDEPEQAEDELEAKLCFEQEAKESYEQEPHQQEAKLCFEQEAKESYEQEPHEQDTILSFEQEQKRSVNIDYTDREQESHAEILYSENVHVEEYKQEQLIDHCNQTSSQESEHQDHQESENGYAIGFVCPDQQENVEGYDHSIPYEMLPNHLKGFTNPTVFPASYYDPDSDATNLKKAMKGLGADKAAIIEILTKRNNEQRLHIADSYERLFQKSLVNELKKELSGDFEDVILALMTSPYAYLASELRRAVKGTGTNENTLIEILCTCDDDDIRRIKDVYEQLFRRTLKDDVYEDTSGDFRKVLLSILTACREDPKASPASVATQLCETDAKGKITLDEDTLRTVLVSYTRPFLYSVFVEYENKSNSSFESLIKTVSSGDARDALIALYKGIVSLPEYFAEELYASMKGLGAKDSKLIRIIVSRSEIDLEDIKEAFEQKYAKALGADVKKDTSGDYRKTLLAIIEGCNKDEYRESVSKEVSESNL